MEKLYFSRTIDGKKEPGNVNVGLISEGEIVRLSLYSDAFYLSDEAQVKVALKRQNDVAPFEEYVFDIDKDDEHLLKTVELGIRNDVGYEVVISLPGAEGLNLFLDEQDTQVESIKQFVEVITMTKKEDRPMAFLSKAGDEQGAVVDIFAQAGVRLIVAEEGVTLGDTKEYQHKNVENKEVSGTLFQKVLIHDTLDMSHVFLEVGPDGKVVASYRREYFIGSLIARETNQEPQLHGGVIAGKVMYDVTPLIETFDFDLAGGIPEQALLKVGVGVTDQTYAQPELLSKLILEAKTYDKVNSSGYMGYEKPAESYALTNGAIADAGASAMVSLVKGNYGRSVLLKIPERSSSAGPKVKCFYRGDDLHVVVYGKGVSALVYVAGAKPVFKAKGVTNGETHFRFVDSKHLIGSIVHAVIVDAGSSIETLKTVQDIEEIYPITPVISEVLYGKEVANFKFIYPTDPRYSHARLFKDGVIVRDKINGASINVQALMPGTQYTFELAFVDIEEYESVRVPITFKTEETGTINYATRIELKVDDIEVTFKI